MKGQFPLRMLIACCACIWTIYTAGVAVAASAWGELDDWVGKYPTSKTSGSKPRRILDVQPIRTEINKLLSASDRKLLSSYRDELPIEQVDGFVVIDICKPHDCPAERAMVVLDTKAPRLWVGFFERRTEAVSTRWYGNADDYVVLSATVLRQFRERHAD